MYTWGQIRFLVQQWAGTDVTLDAIDHAINSSYRLILNRIEWKDLDFTGFLRTVPGYNVGSVNVTTGSQAVTGVATAWTSAMSGRQIFIGGSSLPYTVTVISPTTLVLDRPFEDLNSGTLGYWIVQTIYQLPDNCRTLQSVGDPYTGMSMVELSESQFNLTIGSGAWSYSGAPYCWTPQPNGTNGQTGATVKQILLYPIPTDGRSYPISYRFSAGAFNGSNVTDGPLSFVSDAMMVAGAKAAIARDKRWQEDVMTFTAEFENHYAAELHVETAKQAPKHMEMDPHYTNHRVERMIRNSSGYWRGGWFE